MPVDLGAEYLHGMQTAGSMVEARQHLAAERERIAMEAQAREQTQQRITLEETARRQTEAAYHQAQLGLAQQRLQQAATEHAARAKEAALKMADQHGFAQDLASGMPIEQALYRHPRLSSPAAAIAAHKDSLDLGSQRLDLAKQRLEQQTTAREAALALREQKMGQNKETTTELFPAVPAQEAQPAKHHWFSSDEPAVPAVPAQPARHVSTVRNVPAAAGATGTTPAKRIRVKNADGKTGTIPVEHLPEALKNGYTQVEEPAQ